MSSPFNEENNVEYSCEKTEMSNVESENIEKYEQLIWQINNGFWKINNDIRKLVLSHKLTYEEARKLLGIN